MMTVAPVQHVLFWIAVFLAPPDTSRIVVQGPEINWAWTRQETGWSCSADRSVWTIDGTKVSSNKDGKSETKDVANFVKGIKEHDWSKSPEFAIDPRESFAKRGENLVTLLVDGSPRGSIRYQRTAAADAKAKGGENVVRLGYVGKSSPDKRSLGDSGHAIAFQRPADAKYLGGIQIYASRYGLPKPPAEDFRVYVLDKDQQVVKTFLFPYSLIERGAMRWCTLYVPPTEVPEQFQIALSFDPQQTKGIYLGLDRNVERSHSYVGLPDTGFEPVVEKYDWMVRAAVASDPERVKKGSGKALGRLVKSDGPTPVRLSHVADTSPDKRSIGGSGHAVAFERPANAKSVKAVAIYASRYGTPQPPSEDFHVWLLDQDHKVIKDFLFPCATIQWGEMRWYTLPIAPTEVPEKFYVALGFDPQQTKGIYLGLDKNVKQSHSFVGLPADGFKPVEGTADWMVRVYLSPDKKK